MKQTRTILRNATRKYGDKLNIITYSTHERYQANLAKTGHTFWLLNDKDVKPWKTEYAPVPDNHHFVENVPEYIDVDLILSQNIAAHMPKSVDLARDLRVPIINLHHVLPSPGMPQTQIVNLKNQLHDISVNVFISEYNKKAWGFGDTDAKVIQHCVDIDFWFPTENGVARKQEVLSVVNDWINRDIFCGFNLWAKIVGFDGRQSRLPIKVLGNTPGLSRAAKDLNELRSAYQESLIFLNTSLISPIPSVVCEAMACGCCVISTNTCMLPEVIKHGVNGLLFDPNDVSSAQRYIQDMLQNPDKAKKLGENARKTMIDHFKVERFANDWNNLFYEVLGEKPE